MAEIIAVANHKGGVAKTTSVGAIGTILAKGGNRVLIADLDPQANLTYSFIDIEKSLPDRFIFDAIRERRNLPQLPVAHVSENLFLVPSGLQMTLVESEMYSMRRREYILQDLFAPVGDDYDIILLDCPPSLTLMTTNALTVADRVTVPMNVDQLSYYGLKMMKAYVESMTDLNAKLKIDDIFFTRYDGRERLSRKWETAIRTEFGSVVMKSFVRKNVKVGEAVSTYCSVVDYDPECPGTEDYIGVTKELIERINRK